MASDDLYVSPNASWIIRLAAFKLRIAESLAPLASLFSRLIIAQIFFASAVLKLPAGFLGIGEGSWDSTILLFTYEHPVPFFDPTVAATLGVAFEVLCPLMLVLGLGGRIGAVILLAMTLFIEFSYLHSMDHILWMAILTMLVTYGPGKFSLDYLIRKRLIG